MLSAPLAAVAVFMAPRVPQLVGDGIADDTAALQALFDSGKTFHLDGGTYRLTRHLDMSKVRGCLITNCEFLTDDDGAIAGSLFGVR